MYYNEDLQNHLETSATIRHNSAIIAEWNMNIATNIDKVGNYRYRPLSTDNYQTIPNTYDPNDDGNFYTDATDADIIIDGGYDDQDTPTIFLSKKQKNNLLYSLEDCFGRFRPRSGINKAKFVPGKHVHHSNIDMCNRPRYYMGDKDDKFKYWSSYRTESGIERGIANQISNAQYYIDDAAPFVVYKNPVPANRIVVKMQTHVGSSDLGVFSSASGSLADPFYGNQNSQTPVRWKVQYLSNNTWVDAVSFNQSSSRKDGSPVIGSDGYVEISYGLIVPEKYQSNFVFAEELANTSLLPERNVVGYAYLIKLSATDIGKFYVWSGDGYDVFNASYGWQLEDTEINRLTNFVKDFTSPPSFVDPLSGQQAYREISYVSGLRVVVEAMNVVDSTFDLIELSPRLTGDLTDRVASFDITKNASDLGISGMPVGQLLASVGGVTIFDYDKSFSTTNPDSIIANYISKNIQFKFFDIVIDVDGYDYYIPIKTMYSEGFPDIRDTDRQVTLALRDLYFYFESMTAPEMLATNVSLSYAISLLLDSVGFSNYVFLRNSDENEIEIPYFFIPPDQTVIEVLQQLALSTQTAMFFDEENNFVMMSKDYIMPSADERETDIVLYGSDTNGKLANIGDISSQNNIIYNDGQISYTSRYIQRSYGSIKQASMVDKEKTWIYKPVLLWEVSGEQTTKSVNNVINNQSSYVLSAIPLNSDLSDTEPTVVNHQVTDNIIDLGEAVYWLGRYNGYFYSGGEIIQYDAIQYSVPGQLDGDIWITSVQEYQNYFSKIPFNGKMYPTGLVRIYSEPFYEEVDGITRLKNGSVRKHGRSQFGTNIAYHSAGINQYWSNNDNVRGCTMDASYLFGSSEASQASLSLGSAGVSNSKAQSTTRNGIIKNFLSSEFKNDSAIGSQSTIAPGTIQSSALVMNGPSFTTTEKPVNFISYVTKKLDDRFTHFGTRMRIVGKVENSETRGQTPIGTTTYYSGVPTSPTQSVTIGGGSGGLGLMLNPSNNNGYYFEIIALTENNLEAYDSDSNIHNILFYKIMSDGSGNAIPVKLWGGLGKILVDDGKFTGQYRMVAEENPTVYDLSVEYKDIGNIRRFYLYINNTLITTVDDESPLPVYNNIAPFIRGSSRCMFENIYAITNNYAENTAYALDTPVNSAYQDSEIDVNESFRKYALSGIIQSSYLSGISPSEPPKYNIYFEEFGSIMREAAYFNIRYDKAYPALYATLSPTFNRLKGYTSAGFIAGSYGAEFMVFNSTDTLLSLDETSGNYLRIQGITFTQESEEVITVDDYFKRRTSFSNPVQLSSSEVISPIKQNKEYLDIKSSRITHGTNEFSLNTNYIQSKDAANEMMGWLVSKVMQPRKSVGATVFGMPTLQLGDIVQINYKDSNGVDQVASESDRFVVYSISYSRNADGPQTQVFLSEVK